MRPGTCLLALAIGALAAPAAYAQTDVVGEWGVRFHEDAPERGQGPDVGEYMGTPVNAADIAHADAWSASILAEPEHQCFPHPTDYQFNFSGVRILKEIDPLTQRTLAYHLTVAWSNPDRIIWMDDRPHPGPNALHTWEGFSTGHWEGDTLVVDTTHLKLGYIRRNGLIRSEKARVREYFTRVGDVLTWTAIVYDPVYLTEPMIRNRDFALDPGFQIGVWPCSSDVEVVRPEGLVPHYLPGQNPSLTEFAQHYNLPLEAARTGAESMYPDFQAKLARGYQPPPPGSPLAAPASAKRGAK